LLNHGFASFFLRVKIFLRYDLLSGQD